MNTSTLTEITGILDEASIRVERINLTFILVISGKKYEFVCSDVDFESAGRILAMLQHTLSQKISVSFSVPSSKLEIRTYCGVITIGS